MPRAEWSFLASSSFEIPLSNEQKKIADCLGSLDDLIAAVSRKLETLRQHKQGLMQQLFPQPGETLPKLRFPEFRNTENWEAKKLGDVICFIKGKYLPKSALCPEGRIPCIHYGELFTIYTEVINTIKSRTNIEGNSLVSINGDVLVPCSGETPDSLATACCIQLNDVILGGDILALRAKEREMSGEFLARYIRRLERKVLQLASGSTIYHLYASNLEKLELCFPKIAEQRKIAGCLGALDDLIEAEDQKIETLRQHKQGLMQRLFPSLETQ